jgi:hypothetical protein
MHFTLVHCSWMNQVERWFSILQRKRFVAPSFRISLIWSDGPACSVYPNQRRDGDSPKVASDDARTP